MFKFHFFPSNYIIKLVLRYNKTFSYTDCTEELTHKVTTIKTAVL
jgi:hypothetical protein